MNWVTALPTTAQRVPLQIGTATWKSVATSNSSVHTCGVRTDGSLWCWGASPDGALGQGATTFVSVPAWVGTKTWRSVSVGNQHTVGVLDD